MITYFICAAQYERRLIDSASYWGSSAISDSYSVCEILERWWSDCGLSVHETKFVGFYVQISMLNGSQNFLNKEDIGNVSCTKI